MADPNTENITDTPVASPPKVYRVLADVPDIGRHTINLILALVSVWIVHLVLAYSLGKEAKFFDWIPVRYVTDSADIVLIAKFIWHLIKNFNKDV